MKKTSILFFALLIAALFGEPASASVSECNFGKYNDASTIYVARDGSGDYNCDGTDDQVQINAAFKELKNSGGAYKSVYLKGGTYIISGPIDGIVSNSTFEGDSGAIVRLKDHAGWNATYTGKTNIFEPLIGTGRTAVNNVEIKCFELDINYANNFSTTSLNLYVPGYPSWKNKKRYNSPDLYSCCESKTDDRMYGLGYYTGIYFLNSSNISIHDMYIHSGMNDGIKFESSVRDVEIYDNVIYKMGHEGVFAGSTTNLAIYRNVVTARISSGLRTQNASNVSIFNNVIDSVGNLEFGAGPGVQIDPGSSGIKVYQNIIYKTSGPGVWVYANTTGIDISNNIFAETGVSHAINYAGGVVTKSSDITVRNNVFDSSYQAGVYVQAGSANVLNNIIINTQKGTGISAGSYYGIKVSSGSATSRNNCFYNNSGGDYGGSVSNKSGDLINTNPLFVSPNSSNPASGDYHIKSVAGRWDPNAKIWTTDSQSSPCIDKGNSSSLYANEPAPNGGIINIGRYGNTTQASLSGTIIVVPPDPVDDTFSFTFTPPGNSSSPSSPTYSSSFSSTFPAFFAPSYSSPPDSTVYITPTLTVVNGSGSGVYNTGDVITITADAPSSPLYVFRTWYGATDHISDFNSSTTTVTMPNESITITALYEHAPFSVIFSKFSSANNPIEIVTNILKWLLLMAGAIGFIVIIIGGVHYITSSGDEQKSVIGKRIVTQAVFGLVIILLSYAIISVIAETFVD
ncbi:MAG: right-handed parallel beta-helix repeat-containing protein [Candidatus Pacebacteria bacterium]|nr:right-handed parallel beta-helix repeat-containing protein [Candidatus Paceibacterota bacterium]